MRKAEEIAREFYSPEAPEYRMLVGVVYAVQVEAIEEAAKECERLAAEASGFNMEWSTAAAKTCAQYIRAIIKDSSR